MPLEIDIRDVINHVGRDLGASGWVTVTQEQINEFARVTGDNQWMHVDVERAGREMGGTISHGLLIACLLPQLQHHLIEVTGFTGGYSYGFDKLRFTHPVRPGQRVRVRMTIDKVTPKDDDGRLVTLKCVMEIDGETRPALVADYVALFYGANQPSPVAP